MKDKIAEKFQTFLGTLKLSLEKIKLTIPPKDSLKMHRAMLSAIAWFGLMVCLCLWLSFKSKDTKDSHDFLTPSVQAAIQVQGTTQPENAVKEPPSSDTEHVKTIETTDTDFDLSDPRPRISIVLTGVGMSGEHTQQAILETPEHVVLAFSPYADELEFWTKEALHKNHELLLSIPMEPDNFPKRDPGPMTLMFRETTDYNLQQLDLLLEKMNGYIGYTNFMGSKLLSDQKKTLPIFRALKQTGLFFLENRLDQNAQSAYVSHQIGLPFFKTDVEIDTIATTQEIGNALEKLEAIAKERGYAIGVGSTYPVTTTALRKWSKSLNNKNITLSPITAVIKRAHGIKKKKHKKE